MLTLEIFRARQRGDLTLAVTETVILAIISLGALIVFQRYEGTRKFAAAAMKGAPRRRTSIGSGAARVLATVAAVIFALVLISAGGDVATGQFCAGRIVDDADISLPTRWRIISDCSATVTRRKFSSTASRCRLIAAVAAMLWSFCVVMLLRRGASIRKLSGEGGRRLLSLLVLVPWALPGTVVAVSVVAEAYGQPSLLLFACAGGNVLDPGRSIF